MENENATKLLKDGSNQEVLIEVDQNFRPSKSHRTTRPSSVGGAHMALLLATMFATMTFHAALRIDSLMLTRAFVLFNSMAFFSSIGLIVILLHHLPPLMPWLLILVASFSGAYICAVMASTSVDEATTVALLGASVLIAAIVNCVAFKFNRVAFDCPVWIICKETSRDLT